MKNLFFSLATIAIISLSSFTTINNASQVEEIGTVPCKWRTQVVVQGIAHYSEWTHGNCNVTDSGVLTPIR